MIRWLGAGWVGLAVFCQPLAAKDVSLAVVYRNHLTETAVDTVITGKLWDSTAGSWIGTRPSQGVAGLPATLPVWENGIRPQYRFPLSPVNPVVGWPGRIAVRLDYFWDDTSRQRCSGSLVGPRYVLSAAHCVHDNVTGTIQEGWVTDSFFIRAGYNLGQALSGYDRVRVVKSWLSKSTFSVGTAYPGDNDWAILELERDVGTEVGWARVTPVDYSRPSQNIHFLGYPFIPPRCKQNESCDSITKTDTLCHSWGELYYDPNQLGAGWVNMAEGWGGESGSGAFRCPDDSCHTGKISVIGTRWTAQFISSIDSTMSGIISSIIKRNASGPVGVERMASPQPNVRFDGQFLQGLADRQGQWQILSLDGRRIGSIPFGKTFSMAANRLPHGVTLVRFQAVGQAPVVHRLVLP